GQENGDDDGNHGVQRAVTLDDDAIEPETQEWGAGKERSEPPTPSAATDGGAPSIGLLGGNPGIACAINFRRQQEDRHSGNCPEQTTLLEDRKIPKIRAANAETDRE